MSKPKNMTPEQEAAWKAHWSKRNKEAAERRKTADPEKFLAQGRDRAKKSYHKHKEKRLENQKKRRAEDPDKTKRQRNQSRRKWAETHPDQNKEYIARAAKNTRDRITDNYVASVMRTPVKWLREHLPEAIEAKREEILARRSNPLTNKRKK